MTKPERTITDQKKDGKINKTKSDQKIPIYSAFDEVLWSICYCGGLTV